MDMTDAIIMGLTSFKIALVFHIAGAFLLFAAVGLETLVTVLLRRTKSLSRVRLAVKIERKTSPVFGLAGVTIFLSGAYLTYLDWHYGETIGWIIVAASAFVALAVYSEITGRKYTAALEAEIEKSGGKMTDKLIKLTSSRGRLAQAGISISLILGILVVMIFQPEVSVSVVILISALGYGLIFALIPQTGRSRQNGAVSEDQNS